MCYKNFIKTMSFMIFIYSIYFISTIFQSDFWGNILSPIVGLSTFLMLFTTVLKIKEKNQFVNKMTWLFLSLAILGWFIADVLWALCYFYTAIDPEESVLITNLYSTTNISILIAILIFGTSTFKGWNMLQLLLDSISISISTILLLWILFFNKNFEIISVIINEDLDSALFIIFDMLILVAISIWFLSVRKGKIPTYTHFVFYGVLIYVITDLYFFYLYFNNSYIPNSLIDSLCMSSFLFLSIGAIYKRRFECTQNREINFYHNVGFQKRRFLFFIYLVLAIIFKEIDIPYVTIFLIIILIREILSNYIQSSVEREELLLKEKKLNLILEEKIKQRTKEITDKNKELEIKNKELDFLSNRDSLTNLYNRRFFMEHLKNKLESVNSLENIVFFYMDLDRFKTINDMYGHQVGDQTLIEISRRLGNFNQGNFIIARLGSDEFVLVCHDILESKDIERLANSIIAKCSEPIEIGEYVFHISVSMGISIYPLDAKDSYMLMKNADIAMYEAKTLGKNRFVFFNYKFKDTLNRKNEIENLLKKANFDSEFELVYQPQFNIIDKKLIGAEALLRWNSKDIGQVSPAEFIPIAEEIDYISSIGEWVMEKAIKQVSIWNDKSFNLKVGINVSPKQLDNKNFITNLKIFMEKYSVSPNHLDIEITENVAIEGEYRIKQIESLFSGLGISISIDDFGTGYSSLCYLKIFPFERIKIAKPLIDVISTDSFDFQIVKAVIMLAKSIGIKTIAEGVEFQEQLDILTELGCDQIQGYLFGKPMSVTQFEKMFIYS